MPRDHPIPPEIAIQAEPDTSYVVLADGLAITERFTAAVTPADPAAPICRIRLAIEEGRPVCIELRCERQPGGRSIAQAVLRTIPVGFYISRIVEHSTFRFTRDPAEGWGPELSIDGEPAWKFDVARELGASEGARRSGREYARASLRQPRRGIRTTDDEIREVALIYRAARAEGKRPTKAVMERLHAPRATASRWVRRARDLGYLEPAQTSGGGKAKKREGEGKR